MFTDNAKIFIQSGKGGDGHVSFRRELYVPAGGPDGGDGGRGGDIIFEVYDGLNTLADFRHVRKYVAENGEPGGKKRCHGADGKDLVIRVPEGTVIRDDESGKVIADMSGENRRLVVLRGGRGGVGNMHFATATMQAPNYAKPGQPGKGMFVRLELKVIADVGLVGFPNVGKSTLLSRVSNAKPEIANYHFTTLRPHLGVVDFDDGEGFVMADLPGLIEGASEGVGLGYDFLRHVERTKVLVHVVDAASTEGRDPVEDVHRIRHELEKYDPALLTRPQIIAANKIDSIQVEEGEENPIDRLRTAFPDLPLYPISGVTGEGIRALTYGILEILRNMKREVTVFEPEMEISYLSDRDLPYTIERDGDVFVVEGPRIEKMLGYTNLESEKGFNFFQNFLKDSGILEELERAGIQDGDTVRMYGHEFDYYK
ncbi:GTPase ObgE [Stomatobaculum longum]|uniref:GTPase ObgE n=1 Tax=Stomatobaculum longum TaxID=796942 RepID=UPI0028EDEE2B|nr:GTPase ObgE [Stomatobaculum longum]